METSLIERASAAAKSVLGDYASPAKCEAVARAVLEAVKEPTAAMREAGFEHTADPCWPEDVGRAYRAMIDAALTQPSPSPSPIPSPRTRPRPKSPAQQAR